MNNIGYILKDTKTNDCAIVDPAWDANVILNHIDALNGTVAMILLTHTHFDHVNALDALLDQRPCPIRVSSHASLIKDSPHDFLPINDGEELWIGATKIIALETWGTPHVGYATMLSHTWWLGTPYLLMAVDVRTWTAVTPMRCLIR